MLSSATQADIYQKVLQEKIKVEVGRNSLPPEMLKDIIGAVFKDGHHIRGFRTLDDESAVDYERRLVAQLLVPVKFIHDSSAVHLFVADYNVFSIYFHPVEACCGFNKFLYNFCYVKQLQTEWFEYLMNKMIKPWLSGYSHSRFEINLVMRPPTPGLLAQKDFAGLQKWYEKELEGIEHHPNIFQYPRMHTWVAKQNVESRHCFINENSGNLIIHTIAQLA